MKIMSATEKFELLVAVLRKLYDHGKAESISTRRFSLSKTIKMNQKVFLHFFFGQGLPNFCLQKSTLSKTSSTCNTEKYQLVIRFGKAKHLKVSVILFKRARTFFLKNEKNIIRFSHRSFPYTTFKANTKSLQNAMFGLWFSSRFF